VKNNYSTGAIAFECLVYYRELIVPGHELFDTRNIREAEGD
jgi:hypothetical protein